MSDGETTAATDTDELTYILLRRGTTLRDISNIHDEETVESQLTRGRGGSEIIESPTDPSESSQEDHKGVVKFNEGQLTTETSYFMHFIPDAEYRNLSAFDIASLPQNTAYPVSQTTLNSLPAWALSELREKGHLKIKARYNKEKGEFSQVHEGWNTSTNPYDRILKLAEQLDGDILHAVYYLANKNGSKELSDPEAIANLRGIKPESVEDAIAKVEKQIDTDS